MISKTKKRTCAVIGCRVKFMPSNSFHKACSPLCAYKLVEQNKRKKEKAQKVLDKLRLETLQPKSYWIKKAQVAFNKFIRERDKDLPCISCGNTNPGTKINAGHYLSVGSTPALRFHPMNCHKQCEHCNSFRSGNIALYRPNLIEKVGAEMVDYLENFRQFKQISIDDIKRIEQHYKRLWKEIS